MNGATGDDDILSIIYNEREGSEAWCMAVELYGWRAMSRATPNPYSVADIRKAAQTLLHCAESGALAELHHAVSDLFGVVDGSDQESELFEALLEGLRHTGSRPISVPSFEKGGAA